MKNSGADSRIFDAKRALAFEVRLRKREHGALVRRRKLEGDWDDVLWSYKGQHILFVALRAADGTRSSNRIVSHKRPLQGVSADLARCVAIKCIEQGRSPETINSYLASLRVLDDLLGPSLDRWAHLTKKDIVDTATLVETMPWSESSRYSRLCHLRTIVAYFNDIYHIKARRACRFLPIRINWKHKSKNPVRSWLDNYGERAGFGGKGTVPDGLERAVAQLHQAVKTHPAAEPRDGFDSVRVNSLPFKLGMGLRVGEVVSLPLSCLDTEQITGSPFLRVWTEKGQTPTARPVPQIWYPIIRESIDEITRVTRTARNRARQIEESGFDFIDADLAAYRRKHPLSKADEVAISAAGFSPIEVAWPYEIEAVFDEPSTAFTANRKYADAAQIVAPLNMSAVVSWLDQRLAEWDWETKKKTSQRGGFALTRWVVLSEVAREAGVSIADLKRIRGTKSQLSPFVAWLDKAGVRPGVKPPQGAAGTALRAAARKKWAILRLGLLAAKRGNGHRVWVDIGKWKAMLKVRYSTALKRHLGTQDVSHHIGQSLRVNRRGRHSNPRPEEQRLSEQLFVVWEHTFSSKGRFNGVLPYPVERHDIYSYLCANSVKKTAFQRFGIVSDDGKPFSVGPHQIRHWLTNAMLRSGPSEALVDLWMGRSPTQSRMYDHRTARERAELARDRYLTTEPPNDHLGRCVIQWRKDGVSKAEIAALVGARLQILHFTPYGACARELTVMPCQRAVACVRGYGTRRGCAHFVIDLEDQGARANLEQMRIQYESALLALEPRYTEIRDRFLSELNSAESLDQNLMFLHEMVEGIRTVLHEYAIHDERRGETDEER